MLLNKIKFSKFRNLDLEYSPVVGFNVILGSNGKGKSNFLDGLFLLSTGRSFKGFTNQDNLDFREDTEFARVEAILVGDQNVKLSSVFSKAGENRVQHKFFLNEKPTLRNKFTYQLKTILFTPESLELLTGSPDNRRDELDDLISIYDKEYANAIREYSYVMRSRNKLLYKINQGRAYKEQLTYWTDRLVVIGTGIVLKRVKFLKEIVPSLQNTSQNLFNEFSGDKFLLAYVTSLDTKEKRISNDFIEKLENEYSRELILGRTLVGPHRDDLEFSINGRNLHVFGSRGEQRLSTMIFKIASFEFLTELYNTKVIFLLDDILSELDKQNKAKLVDYISTKSTQVFFTLANKSDLPKSVLSESKILEL